MSQNFLHSFRWGRYALQTHQHKKKSLHCLSQFSFVIHSIHPFKYVLGWMVRPWKKYSYCQTRREQEQDKQNKFSLLMFYRKQIWILKSRNPERIFTQSKSFEGLRTSQSWELESTLLSYIFLLCGLCKIALLYDYHTNPNGNGLKIISLRS